jgi:Antirestriction protein
MKKQWQEIVDAMLADMAKGVMPWVCPWSKDGGGLFPVSGVTGNPYSGINVFILWGRSQREGWSDNRFFTFKAAVKAAAEGTESPGVRKGERGTKIIFPAKMVVLPEASAIDGKTFFSPTSPVLKKAFPAKLPAGTKTVMVEQTYTVFNAQQCNGLPGDPPVQDVAPTDEVPEEAQRVADLCAAVVPVSQGGDMACYIPSLDQIRMPLVEQFERRADYMATLFHEFAHASKSVRRLNRHLPYAAEELVAESASAFICGSVGIEYVSRHAAYLSSWASDDALSGIERGEVLLSAFRDGQKAARCVLAGLPDAEGEAEAEASEQEAEA